MAKKNETRSRAGTIQVFRDALLRIIQNNVRYNNADGVVKDVDETKFTATVQVNKTVYHNVPLRVLISAQASFIEIPKKETNCVIIFRDMNNSRPYILEVHECTKVICKVGDSILNVQETGFSMARSGSGLKKSLSDLIDAINALTVTTPSGPSGTPINAASFTSIKNDLNNYLT